MIFILKSAYGGVDQVWRGMAIHRPNAERGTTGGLLRFAGKRSPPKGIFRINSPKAARRHRKNFGSRKTCRSVFLRKIKLLDLEEIFMGTHDQKSVSGFDLCLSVGGNQMFPTADQRDQNTGGKF